MRCFSASTRHGVRRIPNTQLNEYRMFRPQFAMFAAGLVIGLTVLSCGPAAAGLFGSDDVSRRGLVVGDEPSAVRVAAKILGQGGSAVDAAAAMYFALSVTYPVAAGLGGGGICVVRDAQSGRSTVYDFLPRAAAAGGDFAVPGNVRGFALMQNAFGVLPWARVVVPAEGLAAAGFPISRALALRLRSGLSTVRLDASLAAQFLDESGEPQPEGTVISNRLLATTLGEIRQRGPEAFYRGGIAQKVSEYSIAQGGAISLNDLSAYRAGESDPHVLNFGTLRVYLPSMRLGAGTFSATLVSLLVGRDGNPSIEPNAAGKALVEAMKSFNVSEIPKDMGSTGFAVLDKRGQAVSCAVTMNGAFGSGRTVEGTAVTLAKSPADQVAGLSPAFLTTMIATTRDDALVLSGVGAGGPNASASIANTLLRLARGERVARPGDFLSTGAAPYETQNAVLCNEGGCAAFADPDADGIAASEGQ